MTIDELIQITTSSNLLTTKDKAVLNAYLQDIKGIIKDVDSKDISKVNTNLLRKKIAILEEEVKDKLSRNGAEGNK